VSKRVMIAAGGTGGHFYPGLVAAKTLRARGWEPLLVVREGDPALPKLESEGLAALPVDLRGLPRRPGPELAVFAWKLARSLGTLSRAVAAFRPDLVVGMGGYLSFPLVYAAWRRGTPRALHESNAILGLANAASARLGARLFWGLPPHAGAGEVVGTPVRAELLAPPDRAAARRALGLDAARPVVLAFGGNQGAAAINASLPEALKPLAERPQVLHLAGRGRAEETARAYREAGVEARVLDYLEDMPAAYAAADFVVSRAGASTLAELAALRKPAALVPFPRAAAQHQDFNARVFERAGAALRVPEGAGFERRLGAAAADLLKSQRREAMSAAYAGIGLPPAAGAADAFASALEKHAAS
jgi:UDP-N-acetylglucosamine--N-acetylmuramyl-(pentapeptide) pyrophosphoryl-undecaprenol N-acetylglucosamine transferase